MMKEYRAQLDTERSHKLSHGQITTIANPAAKRTRGRKIQRNIGPRSERWVYPSNQANAAHNINGTMHQ
ncbi:hypothetical protein ACS0TY_034695 [Phlomoides rotata]